MTFFPTKRSIGTLVSAAIITQSASAISEADRIFFAPPDPLVSTLIGQPLSLAALSNASAAMYVCAIPVGHAVTATIFPAIEISFPFSLFRRTCSALSITFKNSSTFAA